MTVITEHDSEQEREGYDGETSRVSFFIVSDTISVSNLLEGLLDFTGFEVGGTCQVDRVGTRTLPGVEFNSRENFESFLDLLFHHGRCPDESSIGGVMLVTSTQHVQGSVDGSFLGKKHLVNFEDRGCLVLGVLQFC